MKDANKKRQCTPFRPRSVPGKKKSTVLERVTGMEERGSLIPDRIEADYVGPSVSSTAMTYEYGTDAGIVKASNPVSVSNMISSLVGNSDKIRDQSLVFDEENMRPSVAAAIQNIQAPKLHQGIDDTTQQTGVVSAVKSLEHQSKTVHSTTGVLVESNTWNRNADKFKLLRTMPYEKPKSAVAESVKKFDVVPTTNQNTYENARPNTSTVANAIQSYAFKQPGQKITTLVAGFDTKKNKSRSASLATSRQRRTKPITLR